MNNKSKYLRYALVGLMMLVPMFAFAAGDASTILSAAKSELGGLSQLIIDVVSVVMGLIGVAMLAVNLAKYFKGDPSSNDALMKIGGGLLIAVVILQVIKVTLLRG